MNPELRTAIARAIGLLSQLPGGPKAGADSSRIAETQRVWEIAISEFARPVDPREIEAFARWWLLNPSDGTRFFPEPHQLVRRLLEARQAWPYVGGGEIVERGIVLTIRTPRQVPPWEAEALACEKPARALAADEPHPGVSPSKRARDLVDRMIGEGE
ncbi:MAG: hypothetical protein ABFD60_04285 [Bryobacteraceae bacterium]